MTSRSPLPSSPARRLSRAAAVGFIALSTLGLSACQWTSPLTTQKQYDAADGVSVDAGDVRGVNLLVVASAAGGPGTLQGALANDTDREIRASVKVGQATAGPFTLAPHATMQLGAPKQIVLPRVADAPGSRTEVMIAVENGAPAAVRVPVLAPRGPYASLTPTSSPTATGTATPTGPVTATATASPAPATTH